MLAAEELVADVGLGGTSAREIARLAGLKNNVSVQYHFGSMTNLFDEVVRYRMKILEDIRQDIIDNIDENDFGNLKLDDLWKIICFPQLKLRGADGRYQYAIFLCNYLPVLRPQGFSLIDRTFSEEFPVLSGVLRQMRVLLSDVPMEIYDRRITNCNLLFLNACRSLSPIDPDNDQLIEGNPLVQDAFRQSVAALAAPWVS